MTRKSAPKAIELFCGCGGLSSGFLDAGFHVVAGFDKDRTSIEAYNYNHNYRGSTGYRADLSACSGEELLKAAGIKRIDALIGGPPCQAFSIVGKRRGLEDERGSLVLDYMRLVEELKPQVVVLENVPSMAKAEEGGVLAEIVTTLANHGYAVRSEVVFAAEFGVAQMRKRLFIVAIRGAKEVAFPRPTHGHRSDGAPLIPFLSVSDVLDDLPPAGDYGECGAFNHEPTMHTSEMLSRFAKLVPGTRERGSFHDRLHPDRPSYTLRAGTGNFSPLRPVHHRVDRVITVRESARIQGFDDTFIWPDWIPRLQQYRQVGNAVPPPLAKAFASAIALQLKWELDPDKFKGDTAARPAAITMSDEQRRADRLKRIRGASLGVAANAD